MKKSTSTASSKVLLKAIMIASFCMLFFSVTTSAQCNLYYQVKSEYLDNGWTLDGSYNCDLSEGETCNFSRYFYSTKAYRVMAFSCDNNVTDLDLYLYTSSGSIFSRDNTNDATSFISFSPMSSKKLTAKVKNYASSSYGSSRVYIFVFSKYN